MTYANTTPTPAECSTPIEIASTAFAYLGNGRVTMSTTTKDGEVFTFTMAGDTFLKTVKSSDGFFDAHIWDIAQALNLV